MIKIFRFLIVCLIVGIGTSSVSGGFNVGNSNRDAAWVNDTTDLTGGNVNINVDGKTTITGGVIAAVDENGNDNGNLNLATGELEYNDIYDFNSTNESGFGFNTSAGGAVSDKGEFNAHPSGTTTVSMTDKGQESEQTTHATVGSGTITVGGDSDIDLAGLNRDIDNVQEITRDEITGALDGSVTIDNRVILGWIEQPVYETDPETGEKIPVYEKDADGNIKTDSDGNPIQMTTSGWGQIADQHENLVENATTAVGGAVRTVAGSAYATYKTIDGYLTSDEVDEIVKNAYEMAEMNTEVYQQELKEFIDQYIEEGMTDEQKLARIEELGSLPQTEATRNERDALYASMVGEEEFVAQRKQEAIDIVKSHTTDPQFWFMEYGWDTFNPEQKIEMADMLGRKQADAVDNQNYTPVSYPDPYEMSMSDNTLGAHDYGNNKTYLNPDKMDDFFNVVGVVSHENAAHGSQTTVIIPEGGTTTSKAMELNRTPITLPNTGRNSEDPKSYPIYRTSPVERDAFPLGDAVEVGVQK